MFQQNATLLFMGDSVTDCSRSREDDGKLGGGYATMVRDLLQKQGRGDVRVLNRGISGNRAIDLVFRWEPDCTNLQPDYVSILIGVNDTWRRYDSNNPTSDADFEKCYRYLLTELQSKTGASILLITPFLLDINENISRMREDLDGKQAVVKKLAKEFGTRLLDADALFKEAAKTRGAKAFAEDGVHPTKDGHALLAEHWLKAWTEE